MIAIYQVLLGYVFYILYRLHPFDVPLCNFMFLMMLYSSSASFPTFMWGRCVL